MQVMISVLIVTLTVCASAYKYGEVLQEKQALQEQLENSKAASQGCFMGYRQTGEDLRACEREFTRLYTQCQGSL